MSIWLFILQAWLLATAVVVYFARQPNEKVTGEEIIADGGDYVVTKDGRFLEYFTCGSKSKEADFVYIQHGYGQTGKFIYNSIPGLCEVAEKYNLFLFSPTMPGFGLSSNYSLGTVRKLEDWPKDIKLILDKLNVNSFYVSGLSAGCVHAFMIAHAFKDKILGVGVNTPTTSFSVESGMGQIALATKFVRVVMEYQYFGDVLGYLMSKMSALQRMEAAPDVAAALNKMERLKEPWMIKARSGYLSDQTRGVVKGHRGWTDNMATINQDLPFPNHELNFISEKGLKFVLTSSNDDTTNPPAMQRYWAETIKGVEIIQRDVGYGHLHGTVPGCFDEIFKQMIRRNSKEKGKKKKKKGKKKKKKGKKKKIEK
eukprot:g1229.t1